MRQPIFITAISSVSALGISSEEVWSNYKKAEHLFVQRKFDDNHEWAAFLKPIAKQEIEKLRNSDSKYKNLDDSVLFAIYTARKALKITDWKDGNFGVNIGSSRGATSLFESYHSEYLKAKKAATLTSPTTTLGNISSWVSHDLNSKGPEISHSITCSTALHAMLNGIAWLQAGMADTFLVGGSEAPLTPFTIAQMKALKIYTKSNVDLGAVEGKQNEVFPCQALNLDKRKNTMILGEGAAVACLEKGNPENALAQIEGIGYATEILKHSISISSDAACFQRSMQMALGKTDTKEIDVVVMHAPGTIKGDTSEYSAIQKVFGEDMPTLTTNKWQVGHTFGASGMLSVELAVLMLKHQEFVGVPFNEYTSTPKRIHKVLVNAVGFGGNAVSILLKIPE